MKTTGVGCRYGCETSDTMQPITEKCKKFALTEYKDSRKNHAPRASPKDTTATEGKYSTTYIYNYTPNLENNYVKLYWDRTLLTDQTVTHNRADFVLVDKKARKTTLIEVVLPKTINLVAKHTEKITKYRERSTTAETIANEHHRNSANHYLIHLNNSKESAEVHQRIRTR